MHATLVKFGYPGTLICDYRHWCVLLRPAQATLAALVLVAKSEGTAFSGLPDDAFAEFPLVVREIEGGLKTFRPHDRLNYLMLMMVDPQVHFHVLPRYAKDQNYEGITFTDPGWPGPPDIKFNTGIPNDIRVRLLHDVQQSWPKD